MTKAENIEKVIEIARSYLGTTEGSDAHREIIDYYNKARYASAYKMTMTDPWCAAFVVACFAKAGLSSLIPCVASCDQMISCFKKWGRYGTPSNVTVTRGSILFYDWNNDGGSDHVGIVTNNNMGLLQVVEGNKSDSVDYRTICISDSCIIGVGLPHYGQDEVSQLTDAIMAHEQAPVISISQYTDWYMMFSYSDRKTIYSLPLLQRGSRGVHVRILQLLLRYRGDFDIAIDGDFGDETHNAVVAWQTMHNLETDGVVGRQTWASMLI